MENKQKPIEKYTKEYLDAVFNGVTEIVKKNLTDLPKVDFDNPWKRVETKNTFGMFRSVWGVTEDQSDKFHITFYLTNCSIRNKKHGHFLKFGSSIREYSVCPTELYLIDVPILTFSGMNDKHITKQRVLVEFH